MRSSPRTAETEIVFGPRTYTRATGAPVPVTDRFTVSDTNTTFELSVDNAGVASAVITLNGEPVFVESDFNLGVQHLAKPVSLREANELAVEVRSKPGSSLTVTITGVVIATTLRVHAFMLDQDAAGGKGAALGAGVQIQVDGAPAGETDAAGFLSVRVAPGDLTIDGRVPGQAIGSATASIARGQTLDVDLLLDFERELVEEAALAADEITGQLLDVDFSSLTLRFTRGGNPVALTAIDSIDLLDRNSRPVAKLEADFGLDPQGAIRASDLTHLRSVLLSQQGAITLRVMASGAALVYQGDVSFFVAQFRVTGTLVAPPSAPALNTGGIEVKLTLLGTPVTLTTTSGPGGAFAFPRMPLGLVSFDSSTQDQGAFYYGQGQFLLSRNVTVSLVMRNQDDVRNGVLPITVSAAAAAPVPASSAPAAPADELPADLAAMRAALAAGAPSASGQEMDASDPTPAAAGPVSVTAFAGPQSFPVTRFAVLDVPAGTAKVSLDYSVFTVEWPFFVQTQSVFNDVWSLVVFGGGGGQQLFEITRNVNAQWFALPPFWQFNGSTGPIHEDLNVSALTSGGPTQLTVVAMAMNIGDSQLPTIVDATLGADPNVNIDSVVPDHLTVATTDAKQSHFSIPRPGRSNVLRRTFTVKYTKPEDAEVTNLKAVLKTAGGQELMTVLDEGPGDRVKVVNDTTIQATVTLGPGSTVASQPPPLGQVTYEFTLEVVKEGTEIASQPKNSKPLDPLWRMPDGVPRYSPSGTSPGDVGRDAGGDDWSAARTYNWIAANLSLLTSVNDVSGEHARNIGHATHERGRDIDIYHFLRFSGSTNAQSNYLALEGKVRAAFLGNASALDDLTGWLSAMRTGLGNLAANPDVQRLYTTIGNPLTIPIAPNQTVTIPEGWGRSLLRTGRVTASNGQVLETNLGTWAESNNNEIVYNAIHNNHIHILLGF